MINPKAVEKAVRSLLEWRKSLPRYQFHDDEFLRLILYLNEIPHPDSANTYHIPLPHSLLPESPKICLIIDDTHNNEENLTIDVARKKIESENLPISLVLNLTEMSSDYRSSEARQEIRDSYDLFLAEETVIWRLCEIIWKKKLPKPFDLKDRDWRAQIEKICTCAPLSLSNWDSSVVRVADLLLMREDEIVENVISACNGVAHVVPGNWENIRSLHLRLFGSHRFLIYQQVLIKPETVEDAVRDLLKSRKSKSSDKEDGFLYLDLYLKEIPHPDSKRDYVIFLRHSILSESPKLCFVIDDRKEEGFTKEKAQEKIKSENLQVSNVLKLSELETDYLSPKARRELCDSYDVFLAEESVIPLLAGILEKKVSVSFDFMDGDWKVQIEKACCSTLLCLSTGTYYEVKVAKVSMEMHEIVENVVYAIDGIANVVPNRWGNIASLHLRRLGSHPLPIYQSLPYEDSD